ncbi:type IV pilus modification PilV family protein [Piscinibacter sakaiensis]|uniref:type IV pilus modification PilV family protein n=1 Tax=Piscinibacter sakaiensis TaxID=1547922 RepID=UPI003AB055D6
MTTFVRNCPRPAPRRQRGTSVLEALVGFLLVAVGMVGSAQLQIRLRQAVDLARQQADAAGRAQQELENLRAFATYEARAGLASFVAITDQTRTVAAGAGSPTAYRIERRVRDSSLPMLKDLQVSVDWTDRHGKQHRQSLATILGGQAPALVLPLAQASAGEIGAVLGRHPAIPRDAHDLGDGRSVFKPLTRGSEAWLIDNRSARIVARCAGVSTERTSRQLGSADLGDCAPAADMLLGGRVRHSLAAPPALPDASTANDTPLPMSVTLQLTSSGHPRPPHCIGEAVRMVDVGTTGMLRAIAVAIDATPASQGLTSWTELGDRFWRYHCAIATAAAPAGSTAARPQWSGRLVVTPQGWSLSATPGGRRICRYSADTDQNGRVDRPAESPDPTASVVDPLVEQNLLVVDGRQACPASPAAAAAAGRLPWSDANPATVPHQG